MLLLYKTLKILFHFSHLIWIRWFTFQSISLSLYITDSKYLNRMTYGMIWSPTLTSRLETLILLMNLHFIYFVVLMLKRKTCVSKVRLQVSNLSFKSSFDSPNRTISSAKKIHLGANSLMCYVSSSKIKLKK